MLVNVSHTSHETSLPFSGDILVVSPIPDSGAQPGANVPSEHFAKPALLELPHTTRQFFVAMLLWN